MGIFQPPRRACETVYYNLACESYSPSRLTSPTLVQRPVHRLEHDSLTRSIHSVFVSSVERYAPIPPCRPEIEFVERVWLPYFSVSPYPSIIRHNGQARCSSRHHIPCVDLA